MTIDDDVIYLLSTYRALIALFCIYFKLLFFSATSINSIPFMIWNYENYYARKKVSVAIQNFPDFVSITLIVKTRLFTSPQSQTYILKHQHKKWHHIYLNGTVVKGSYISKKNYYYSAYEKNNNKISYIRE